MNGLELSGVSPNSVALLVIGSTFSFSFSDIDRMKWDTGSEVLKLFSLLLTTGGRGPRWAKNTARKRFAEVRSRQWELAMYLMGTNSKPANCKNNEIREPILLSLGAYQNKQMQ